MTKLTASLKADITCQDRQRSYDLFRRILVSSRRGWSFWHQQHQSIALKKDQLVLWHISKCKCNDWLASDLLLYTQQSLKLHGSKMGNVKVRLCDWGCRLSSCGAQALLLLSIWNLPGPGIKRVSPALASEFPTTGPLGKSWVMNFNGCRWFSGGVNVKWSVMSEGISQAVCRFSSY